MVLKLDRYSIIGLSVLGGVVCVSLSVWVGGGGGGGVVQSWVGGGCCKNKKDYMNLLIDNIFTIMIIYAKIFTKK